MKRIVGIDAYKAFLIVLVVLGHVLQASGADFTRDLIVKFIYSHHMAAFFFLSGYVTYREQYSSAGLLRRIARLLVAFFAWWLVSWLLGERTAFWPSLAALLRAPDCGLWFLYVLSLCHLLTWTGVELEDRLHLPMSVTGPAVALGMMAFELLSGFRGYGVDFLAWYYLFYLLGIGFRRYLRDWFLGFARGRYAPAATLGLFLAWMALLPAWQKNTDIVLPVLGTLPGCLAFGYRLVTIVLAVAAESLVFVRVSRVPALVSRLGQSTMGIYVTHGLLLAGIFPLLATLPTGLVIPLATLILLALALLATLALKKIPIVGGWIC